MKFLEYITCEKTLHNLRDNFLSEVTKLPKKEYLKRSAEFERVFEALSDRIDEIADGVPYGARSGRNNFWNTSAEHLKIN